jgi:hypothetical protein
VRTGPITLGALLAIVSVFAAARAAPAQHPSHEHGAASLEVSVDGRTLQIELDGPADNLLGFEHAPQNDAQKKAVARADELLKRANQLFFIPPAAQCQPQPVTVQMKLPTPSSGETHSEIEAEWRWECAKPEALTYVDVGGLFKAFPRLKQLRVQIATARNQTTVVLKPGSARVKLAS